MCNVAARGCIKLRGESPELHPTLCNNTDLPQGCHTRRLCLTEQLRSPSVVEGRGRDNAMSAQPDKGNRERNLCDDKTFAQRPHACAR